MLLVVVWFLWFIQTFPSKLMDTFCLQQRDWQKLTLHAKLEWSCILKAMVVEEEGFVAPENAHISYQIPGDFPTGAPCPSDPIFYLKYEASVQFNYMLFSLHCKWICFGCWHLLTGFLRLFSRILLYEMVMVDCRELMMELPWGLILLHACCTYERTFHYWRFVTCDMFISINKWLQNSKWINVCSFKRSSRELKLKLWIIWRCNISWYFRIDSIKKRNGYIMS